ncbi:prepilin-type N-terminal cleavage/methylation domain-containing protein [Bacillus suaedae]|uniref:Prepilin-type N-terminal cleavage/methylation domain-containing protein n=1 Tax=Halalkalibacter suaedae TaxID=2822140 RepID=A0A940WT11_9BACI|nr:prepilin-type N-terminal cleavage/methylation domain-containing protein [Bacillus suaedae]MBP3949653.1 prepilin-type N-terminal cleavage/methylation domain-containing protein [Bacillus suaedae]
MFKKLKVMKNERGLTLIELLVVIVIIGIIAAIAVVSIGNIMENSRRDAHVANAQQIANAAKLYFATENDPDNAVTLTVLQENDYLGVISDPSTDNAYTGDAVTVNLVDGEYRVTLMNYITGSTEDASQLVRGDVTLPGEVAEEGEENTD